MNGDRVTWALDQSLPERTFQIDFGVLNPFHLGQLVSFRGSDFAVSTAVNLPLKYQQANNPVFEYSVTLGNGWKDDPRCLVVPEPPDPTSSLHRGVGDFTIKWHDTSESAIDLSPTDLTLGTGNHNTKTVVFAWAAGQPDTQPFTLVFPNAPNGWPTGALKDNGTGLIAPSLPAGQKTAFIITTTSADQSNPSVTATGTLKVTHP